MKALLLRALLYLAKTVIRDVVESKTRPHPEQPLNVEVAGALAEDTITRLQAQVK